MGTSAPYTPTPQWAAAKSSVTSALNSGAVTGQQAHDLLSGFVQQLADQPDEGFGKLPSDFGHKSPKEADIKLDALMAALPPARLRTRVSSGSTSAKAPGDGRSTAPQTTARRSGRATGRGGTTRTGSGAVRSVAQRLAGFIAEIPKVGLRRALINAGVGSVDTLPPDQIALAVADVLAADASLLIQTELRDALAIVMETVCSESQSFEAAEETLFQAGYNLEGVVQLLFECYIMERFKTFFCEHESAKHGYEAADGILKEAREFVKSEMQLEKADRKDLTAVDWASVDGGRIIDGILERTITVYTT